MKASTRPQMNYRSSRTGSCRLKSPSVPASPVQGSGRGALLRCLATGKKAVDVADDHEAVAAAERLTDEPAAEQGLHKDGPTAPAKPAASKGFGGGNKRVGGKSTKGAAKQAAKGGRLDMVEVYDWGSGEQAQLGELKVKRVDTLVGKASTTPAPTATQSSAGTGAQSTSNEQSPQLSQALEGSMGDVGSQGQSSSDAAAAAVLEGGPAGQVPKVSGRSGPTSLFEELCKEMALAERRGVMAVSGPPPPPVNLWSFTPARYLQYLKDCLAVHEAMEAALHSTLPSANSSSSGSSSSGSSGGEIAAGDQSHEQLSPLLSVLHQLGSAGLGRASALRHDLQLLGAQHSQEANAAVAAAGTMATTHAAQIERLGRDVRQWVQLVQLQQQQHSKAGTGLQQQSEGRQASAMQQQHSHQGHTQEEQVPGWKTPSKQLATDPKVVHEVEETGQKAAAALIAHAFALYALHAAGGVRFGAMATEKLGLLQIGAVRFYTDYPAHLKDPLATLRVALDAPRAGLTSGHRGAIVAHIPSAVRSASMLFTALAHTN